MEPTACWPHKSPAPTACTYSRAHLLQDLALDIPDAPHLLALFLGRAVVDEVLAPSFLASVLPALRNDSLGVTVVQTTGGQCFADLRGPHALLHQHQSA